MTKIIRWCYFQLKVEDVNNKYLFPKIHNYYYYFVGFPAFAQVRGIPAKMMKHVELVRQYLQPVNKAYLGTLVQIFHDRRVQQAFLNGF